jgi:hypothetical protein
MVSNSIQSVTPYGQEQYMTSNNIWSVRIRYMVSNNIRLVRIYKRSVTINGQLQYTVNSNMRSITIYGQLQYMFSNNMRSVTIYDQ